MTGLEYLRLLQVQTGLGLDQQRAIAKELTDIWHDARLHGLTAGSDPIANVESLWRSQFVDPLVDRLPSTDSARLKSITFGLLATRDPNAWALKTDSGDDLIVIHSELPKVFRNWQELIERLKRLREQRRSIDDVLGDGLLAIVSSFSSDFAGIGLASTAPLATDISLSEVQRTDATIGAFADLQFVLAHELAHIHLGHTAGLVRVQLQSGIDVQRLTWEQEQEVQADIQAFDWLRDVDPLTLLIPLDAVGRVEEKTGMRLGSAWGWRPWRWIDALVVFLLVEAFTGPPRRDATHPSVPERLAHLAERMTGVLPDEDRQAIARMVRRANALAHNVELIESRFRN